MAEDARAGHTQGRMMLAWPRAVTEPFRGDPYDVAIVGAGVVGCALAYQLSQFKLKVLLIDKNFDVGEATSKGNSAIVHTGFDAEPGTLESQLVTRASRLWPTLSRKLKIPYDERGAILVAASQVERDQLESIRAKAIDNGVDDVRLLDSNAAKELEAGITSDVLGGLLIPRESIADPFTTSVAFAEVALLNGVDLLLGTTIVGLENVDSDSKVLVTDHSDRIASRVIVNAAGLGSRKLADLYGGSDFNINPRRGQFLIFDKHSSSATRRILLPIPTKQTKGVMVIPTIFGNTLAGPTAEDFELGDRQVTDTSLDKLQALLSSAAKLLPALIDYPVIGTFSGVRCNCDRGSYFIRFNDGHRGLVTVTGVRSTGFTSAPAMAEYLTERLKKECGLTLERNPEAIDSRPESSWPGWWIRPYSNADLVRQGVGFDRIVCYCENISRGEIIQHLDSPLMPRTLDGLKRRTRAQMGRCQGFDCQIRIAEIVSEHCGIPLAQVTKRGPGSEIVAGEYGPESHTSTT